LAENFSPRERLYYQYIPSQAEGCNEDDAAPSQPESALKFGEIGEFSQILAPWALNFLCYIERT
jgi:hypothetical protein